MRFLRSLVHVFTFHAHDGEAQAKLGDATRAQAQAQVKQRRADRVVSSLSGRVEENHISEAIKAFWVSGERRKQ
jgi:hypothetical protein